MVTNTTYAPDGTGYDLSGPAQAPVVVLAHGVGLDRHMWDLQVEALTPTHRVLRYDMWGHGASPVRPGAVSIYDFSSQLRVLLKHLAFDRVALVGFSMGGVMAQRFVADYPDTVTRLVLMSTVYRRDEEELRGVRKRLQMTIEQGVAATADAAIERWFPVDYGAAHPEVLDAIRRRLLSNDPQGYADAYRVFVNADDDIGDALRSVTCPALVITGADDVGSTPVIAQRMAADLADAQIVILEGLRHMAPVEDPARVNAVLLEFLVER